MAEHYGFFDGASEYGQVELARYLTNIIEDGVASKNGNLTLRVYKDISDIKIDVGFAIVQGFYHYNDTPKPITITPDTLYSRIDRVVLRLNLSTKSVTSHIKMGTAASSPVAPQLQRDNFIYELSLAQILVNTNGSIVITDERFREDLCGSIRAKGNVQLNDMINQFTEQFDRWFASQQSKGWRNIFIQANKPVESVAGSIWIETL